MIVLELPPELEQRLATLAAQENMPPAQYAGELLRELLRLPNPVNWFARLSSAAHREYRDVLAAAAYHVPSEEAIPAYLPLATVGAPSTSHGAPEDSFAIFLELLSTLYIESCAQNPYAPKTAEIAVLETALAERYFCAFSFADFRRGLSNDQTPSDTSVP